MVTKQANGKWQYKCACGSVQYNFSDEKTAKIAYRLHKLGCEKS